MSPRGARQLTNRPATRPVRAARSSGVGRSFRAPAPLVELVVEEPGFLPDRALVDENSVHRARLRDLPRASVDREHGALDVLLLDSESRQVKGGTAILDSAEGAVELVIDPLTRRFRADGLAPGEYSIRAAAGRATGEARVEIRPDDVTRIPVSLDAESDLDLGEVAIQVAGTRAKTVQIRLTDRDSGAVVFDELVPLEDSIARLRVPYGRLHWYIDDGSRDSCWEQDHNPLRDLLRHPVMKLALKPAPRPDPPDWHFGPLDPAFRGVAPILERLG